MNRPDPDDITADARELAGLFIEARRADLARLGEALAASDFATVAAVGHAFKGSAAAFGFPEAGRIGAQLEEAASRGDIAAANALAERLRASIPASGAAGN